jgi:hypothetical protein
MNQGAAGRFRKDQTVANSVDVHVNEISESDLAGGHEIRKRINQESLDCSLQVTSAVLVVQTFLHQHVFRCLRALKDKLGTG